MSDIKITPRGTIEAEIRECLELNGDDERIEIPRWVLLAWLEKAAQTGMSLDQEQRAAARIREQMAAKDAELKKLRVVLGRYM